MMDQNIGLANTSVFVFHFDNTAYSPFISILPAAAKRKYSGLMGKSQLVCLILGLLLVCGLNSLIAFLLSGCFLQSASSTSDCGLTIKIKK